MRGRLARGIGSLGRGAGLAVQRFPEAIALFAALAILLNLDLADALDATGIDLDRLSRALYAGAMASVAARVGLEAWRVGIAARAVGGSLAAILIAAAVWFGAALGVYEPALLPAMTLAVFVTPFVWRGDSTSFWTYAFWTGVGMVLGFVSVLVFMLGFAAILEMVRYLFGIGLGSTAYSHIAYTALVFVGPVFALGRIPTRFDETLGSGDDARLVGGVRLLVDWVAAPLILAAGAILHLYAATILVAGAMPSGEIGWIVSIFILFVLTLRLVAHPFLADAAWTTRLFMRLYALMLVAPLVLLAFALNARIADEGVTVGRYYLGLGILAAALVVLAQAPRRTRGDLRIVACVPLGLLFLSAIGPLGVSDVVGRSQTARIAAGLGMADGAIAPAATADAPTASLASRVRALDEADALAMLRDRLAPKPRAALSDPGSAEAYVTALGLRATQEASSGRTFIAGPAPVIALDGLDRALLDVVVARRPARVGEDEAFRSPEGVRVAIGTDGVLVVTIDGVTDRFDLGGAAERLPAATFASAYRTVEAPVMRLTGEGGRTLAVVPRRITLDDGLSYLDARLFWRDADWR